MVDVMVEKLDLINNTQCKTYRDVSNHVSWEWYQRECDGGDF